MPEQKVGPGNLKRPQNFLQTAAHELAPDQVAVFRRQTAALFNCGLSAAPEAVVVHLFPHVRADGDAWGAAYAYGRLLYALGFQPVIVAEEPLPAKMAYLETDRVPYLVWPEIDLQQPLSVRLAVALDCHGADRLESREALFEGAPCKMIVDHHPSKRSSFPLYLRDTEAAATCELIGQYFIYLARADWSQLLTEAATAIGPTAVAAQTEAAAADFLAQFSQAAAGLTLDEATATALLTGLFTDTGRFSYSNTTARTLRTAALARAAGGDLPMLAGRHFDEVSRARYELTGKMIGQTVYAADGCLAAAWLTAADMRQTGALEDDTDGLSAKLRDIVGVEAAILLREAESGEWRCSLRSGSNFDVSAFAGRYGGGGHKRAAGMTIKQSRLTGRELARQVLAEMETVLVGGPSAVDEERAGAL